MDLHQFENRNSNQEQIIRAEAYGQSEASFAHSETDKIKQKLELRKKQQRRLRTIFGSLGVIILLLVAFLAYSQYKLYLISKDEMKVSSSAVSINASTTPQEIIAILGRHVLLPSGNPQIAQVQDVEKLRDSQAFFKNAENGDLIIVYENASIFLYRPSRDIVIAVGDISGVGQVKP